MIAERIQQQNNSFSTTTKYYQFSTILEHVIDCFHTIVSDESNPYHPPLGWLTRKQPKPPEDELFLDLHDECSKQDTRSHHESATTGDSIQLSSSVRSRLEKCSLQSRKEIVSRTRDGCPPMFMACKNGLTRVVKYLLDVCGADIEQRGRFEALEDHHVHSVTPIWVAAVSGHIDTVKLLIDRGANINSISDTGSTPLRSVCFLCKDDDGSKEYDNLRDDDYSFGGTADDEDSDIYMKIVWLLVDHGADISRANYYGGTCLINSLHNYQLTEYMINHGAEINASDNQSKTALIYAIQQDRADVAKLLLSRGADPFLKTKDCDDALQLCCIRGQDEIFEYLIDNYHYSQARLADAHRLLGSSILEIHYDIALVRKYWTKSLTIVQNCDTTDGSAHHNQRQVAQDSNYARDGVHRREICDIRHRKAYGDTREFCSERELQMLTVDDFRIQSLLISERILGSNHRETIQRLLYRGTFYINSLRPGRCLDLWIYALKLRLDHESIFDNEAIFAAQAITKLFLDLLSQRQHQQVTFDDVHDVLSLLTDRLNDCQQHLSWRPRSCLHEDMYDLLLEIIVNLLLILRCVRRKANDYDEANEILVELVKLCPRKTNGSTLLHICVAPGMFEGDIYRSLQIACEAQQVAAITAPPTSTSPRNHNLISGNNTTINNYSLIIQHQSTTADNREQLNSIPFGNVSSDNNNLPPVIQLIRDLIAVGLNVDLINDDGLSALHILCLATSIRVADKTKIIELLIGNGAHFDRRASTPEQDEQIRQTLRECGIKPIRLVTLKCLAARRVSELKIQFDKTSLAGNLYESIAIH